ncbi:cryptochrome/photolyase family protein [Yoonia sp. MH D7]
MAELTPVILWFRRDLRLADHAALTAAVASGRPVLPLFIYDPLTEGLGAAAKFRLSLSIQRLGDDLEAMGSRLILRRGPALEVLRDVMRETGAAQVFWSRLYDPDSKARDVEVKAALKADGVDVQSFKGHVLFEPWTVETKTGGYYRVFTPMWKNVRSLSLAACLPAPETIAAVSNWPASDDLEAWQMDAAMDRGAKVLRPYCCVGEAAAADRLHQFIDERVADYKASRDLPAVDGTSRLSENLTYGEISPLTCWHAGWRALHDGKADAEVFLKELVWREFAYHLAHHTPHIVSDNWKPDWDGFAWNEADTPEVIAWKQGRTGIPFVDAAMREMYVTGTMHNRGRMIVASYLTKHLLTHWRVGQAWFADCLIDWDPASNAMGWQWTAGSGPDASPFFRVFNAVTQLEKFDKGHVYVDRWICEGQVDPPASALSYFDAVPRGWEVSPRQAYPAPVVDMAEGRARALRAYEARDF